MGRINAIAANAHPEGSSKTTASNMPHCLNLLTELLYDLRGNIAAIARFA
jgi:hypothetical protein